MVHRFTPELTKKVVQSKWGNYCGLQVVRYLFGKLAVRFRRVSLGLKHGVIRGDFQNRVYHEIKKNGFYCATDFLPEESYKAVKDEFDRVLKDKMGVDLSITDADTVVNRRGIQGNELVSLGLLHSSSLVSDERLVQTLSLLRGGQYDVGDLTYWFDLIVNGSEFCEVSNLHTDVFFDTYKIWYFLEDVKESDGPLVYCPGSHRLSLWRIAFEYTKSLPGDLGKISQPWNIPAEEMSDFKYVQKKVTVPANTLVVANTHGFHRRGDPEKGSMRKQIHFSVRGRAFGLW